MQMLKDFDNAAEVNTQLEKMYVNLITSITAHLSTNIKPPEMGHWNAQEDTFVFRLKFSSVRLIFTLLLS